MNQDIKLRMHDDIPEALRQAPREKPSPPRRPPVVLAAIAIVLVGLGGWLIFKWVASPQTSPSASAPTTQPTATPATPNSSPAPDQLLGHLRYPEAPQDQLVAIVPDRSIKLRQAAAEKYQAMVAAAEAEGVSMVPISGFRGIADQKYLFFDVKAERGQVTAQRAEVSAPPGYSEHHTGYAIDIGDPSQPETHLSPSFDTTPAFDWLRANAAHFSFELSFPKENAQEVSYEPWHWRFVGDQESLETFYQAQNLRPEARN